MVKNATPKGNNLTMAAANIAVIGGDGIGPEVCAEVRKIALLQSVISFVFNLAILGLSVNVGAGLLN